MKSQPTGKDREGVIPATVNELKEEKAMVGELLRG